MDQFSIENQYQFYLQQLGVSEQEMPPIQRKELRQAFFAGTGQTLLLLRDELSLLDEDEAVAIMYNLVGEVTNFFITQSSK